MIYVIFLPSKFIIFLLDFLVLKVTISKTGNLNDHSLMDFIVNYVQKRNYFYAFIRDLY